jgi:hypothetical protein
MSYYNKDVSLSYICKKEIEKEGYCDDFLQVLWFPPPIKLTATI